MVFYKQEGELITRFPVRLLLSSLLLALAILSFPSIATSQTKVNWATQLKNFPADCSVGQFVTGLRSTNLACATPAGGSGSPCVTTALSLQYNNAGAFGCVTEWTYDSATHTVTLGAAGIFDPTAGTVKVPGTNGQLLFNNNGNLGAEDPVVSQPTASLLNAQVVGNIASAAADSGNPVKTGCVFNTTQPTVTTGQRVDCQASARGELFIAKGISGFSIDNTSFAATQSGTWNINNISGTVSLPTGAATAAKQPALGTAGTPSADVITVQGVTSMTPLKVDGSAVTQPVSGTVTANQGGTWTVQPGNTANTTPWLTTDSATSATGSAVPSKAAYVGGNSSGNLTGIIACDSSAFLDMTTATTTQLVALSSGKTIYVCSYDIQSNGTASVKLAYGTGTNCGTGTTQLTSNLDLTAQTGLSRGSGLGMLTKTAASNALCATSSAAVNVHVDVTYTQF